MEKLANEYQTKHRAEGTVSKINEYSFTFTYNKPRNSVKECVVCLSYFTEV